MVTGKTVQNSWALVTLDKKVQVVQNSPEGRDLNEYEAEVARGVPYDFKKPFAQDDHPIRGIDDGDNVSCCAERVHPG
jgi:hypothetical protein